ncbi:MAG: Ig-like domain-containing protein, partial [Proteobacteria bacterium]|nr:Ig-like domain-containing protein [Pseudomonadota bacterium]
MGNYSNSGQQPRRKLDGCMRIPENEAMLASRGDRKMIGHRLAVEVKSFFGFAALLLLLGMSTAKADNVTLLEDFTGTIQHDLLIHCPGCSTFSITSTTGINSVDGIIPVLPGNFLDLTAISDANGIKTFNINPVFPVSTNFSIIVRINQVNDAAAFGGDTSGSGDEDTQITGTLSVTDTRDGMTTPNFIVLTDGTNGTAGISATTGAWTYDGNLDYNGGDTFTVQVTDDDGNDETQVITITVNSVNDAPIYIPGSYSASGYTVVEDSGDIPLPLQAAFSDQDIVGDSDSTDDSLTYTITVIDVPAVDAIETVYVDLPFTVISDDENTPSSGARTTVYETTDASMVIQLAPDGHGYLDVTVRATDRGRPPEAPADPIFLSEQESFRITVQGIGDDTPLAEDDHYSDFIELVMEEDGEPIIFNVLSNDYLGDVPSFVISAGQTITDTSGADHTWRTTSRLTDRNNVGDFVLETNGEVSCANAGCQDDQTADTTITAGGILDNSIMYKPSLDFNGEDTFTYCMQDTFPASEPAFTPPADVRCATVTVNVTPVNDLPRVPTNIIYEMAQAEDLIVTLDNGLGTKVTGVDNTHVDGLGCNPSDPLCVPEVGRDPDTLYFSIDGFTTTEGVLTSFDADGTFTYRPLATFSGSDSFFFNVCETPVPTVETCVFDVLVTIVVDAIEGAPAGLSDDVVEVDFDLADIPLELPVGPEANVLIVNDDSGSMDWDILTDQSSGLYYFDTGNYIYYTMKATAGTSTSVAPGEADAPNQGLWRLRNSDYNKTYYNPDIRYEPWNGLNPNDVDFPNSTPTAALHNALAPAGSSTNLRVPQDYTGRAVITTPEVCTLQCRWYRRGVCRSYRTVCTGGTNFQSVDTENLYLPRYYVWDNKNLAEVVDSDPATPELDLDAVPSPHDAADPNYCLRTYPIDAAAEAS